MTAAPRRMLEEEVVAVGGSWKADTTAVHPRMQATFNIRAMINTMMTTVFFGVPALSSILPFSVHMYGR